MADLATTPTTVLEAVNQCLFAIGEPPVNSIEDNGVIYAVTALQTLSSVNRAVQMKGWHWNEERAYPITPSFPEGYAYLPKNTLRVDGVRGQSGDLIVRGNRLYDRSTRSYEFKSTIHVDIVLLLDFEELPEAARYYITVRAARRFQEGAVGSEQLSTFSAREELLAKVALEDHEAEVADFNVFDNVSVREVLDR